MVYLLKWLISLITPYTHDKEGKQGKSFIVRKALGNRASFSSLASKKGSSLLLVVMTMSVIIVISSSFMLLSFNTGIGSIFASSQQKAQLSCLSVAEGLKDGNTFGSIVNQYSGELSGNQPVEFDVNDSSLDGKTTVKLVPTVSGGSVKSVKVTVTTHVGSSKYEVKFTHTMQTNSVRDVINQVTNSMSVSGGGSFSMQTGKVEGDLALDGDYLLALASYYGSKDEWTKGAGIVDGNVYCNGSLVIGFKNENSPRTIHGKGKDNKEKTYTAATAIPTIVKGNLYVNGDLIINACEIEGDVYVSGNVLVNGLTDNRRGNTSGNGVDNTNNAQIKGNLYVGGSLFVPTGSFSRYWPTEERISTDNSSNTDTGGFILPNGFPKTFPSAAQIYGTEKASDYSNALLSLYNRTISSKSTNSNGEYVFTYNDPNGKQETLSKDFLNSGVSFSGKVRTPYKDNIVFDGKSDKSFAQFEQLGGKLGIVCYAYNAMRVKLDKNVGEKCFEEDTDWDARAYNVLFQLLTSYHWNDGKHEQSKLSQESSKARDENATLRNSVSKEYEKYKLTASYGNLNNGSANLSEQTFTVSKNVYVQGNAFVQFSNKKLGKETYILGELTAYSVEGICNSDGATVGGVNTSFNKLYVGSVANYTFYTKAIIGSMENYYTANMALKASDQETSSLVQHVLKSHWGVLGTVQDEVCSEHKKVFSKGKNYAFYYGSGTFFSSGDYENHSAKQLNYSSYSTTFELTGKETAYDSNQQLYMLFKASNLGGTGSGSGTEGYSVVTGIMSYGSNATWGKITNSVTGQTGSIGRATFDALRLNEDEMYSDEFLKNHNSSAALRTEQKRAEEVDTVADVLKEMGVWGYSEGEIYTKSYQNAYKGGKGRDEFYYNNLDKTGNSTGQYAVGDNKLNDRGGVNFTGVTSATQIKFGYTLQRAINASKNGTITVTSKGSIKHPNATSGTFFGNSDATDWRVLYKSKASYKNSPVGPQNIENLTKYFVYGAGGLGDTFYGRLLFLGAYDDNLARSNNYSEVWRLSGKEKRWNAFNNDVKEVMSYLYNPSLAGEDSAMWEKYGKEYVGVFAYSPDDHLHVYLMRDIYLGGDSYYGFGDKDTDDNDNGFDLHLDTSYRSINVYWGSDANGMLNYASNSTIEISLLFPQQGSFNVAYMYLLPNIAWSNYQDTGYSIMNYQQKIDNIQDIVNAVQVQGAKFDGQNVYKGQSGKYYRYSVKYYRNIDTDGGSGGVGIRDVLNDCKFTHVCRMWNDCKIKNTAIRNNGNLVAAGIPFVMCEGPMLFMMGINGEMSGIIYSPNPYSVFFCASSETNGTKATDPNTTFSGGAIVTGRVIGTKYNDATWQFFEDSDKYDVGELLTKALIEDPYGIGDIDTSGGTNTGGNWSAGGYE